MVIVGFWLVMMGLFLWREYGGSIPREPSAAQAAFVPQDQWMGIYLNDDHRVGHLHLESEEATRDEVPGYLYRLEAALETKLFGVAAGMDITGEAWSAASGKIADFDFALVSSGTRMGVKGRITDNRLQGFLDTGGQSIPLDFPFDSTQLLGGGMGLTATSLPSLDAGESTKIDAFDPMTMKMAQATVTCVGKEEILIGGIPVEARIYETTQGSMTSRAWLDAEGGVLQASTPFGFTLRKIDPAALVIPVEVDENSDLIQSLAITATGEAVSVDADRLVIRISGVAPEKIPHDPPWQSLEGNVLTIIRPTLPEGDDVPLDPGFDPTLYLGGDPFVTTEHPKIRAKAREIVGDEADPWQQALLLYTWIYDEIEKVPVLSVPNALDVLRTEAGDCNEHTVLYTALARSLAIPTRIAIGLVYSDTLEGFGYHAWPEVHVEGRWYPIDPTLGQISADATHIKLFNGGIDAWIQLVAFIGQVELDVISAE